MGRRRMKNYNPMAIAESPMTAPDSVERVVAEMRIPHEGGWDNDDVAALADRLQALARGPQQAGGEDAVQAAARIASEAACLRIDNERLQAEVARLQRALNFWLPTTAQVDPAFAERVRDDAMLLMGYTGDGDALCYHDQATHPAEAALREAHEGEVSQVEWEDSDRIIVHIEKDEGDVMMWEDVREGVRVRIAGPRLVRDGDSGEGES